MAQAYINGFPVSGSVNYASAIAYTEEDGSKTTVQNKISELNKNINTLENHQFGFYVDSKPINQYNTYDYNLEIGDLYLLKVMVAGSLTNMHISYFGYINFTGSGVKKVDIIAGNEGNTQVNVDGTGKLTVSVGWSGNVYLYKIR